MLLKGERSKIKWIRTSFSDFFVSSLSAEDEDLLERSASIKMIDFAHVWPAEVGSAEKYKRRKHLKNIWLEFLLGTALSFVFYFKICSGDKTTAKFSEAAPDFAILVACTNFFFWCRLISTQYAR